MRLAGLVEYEGTGFAGWAAQPGRRTVEGVLSEAISTILRQQVKMSVAGRTDAGVHASGQVVSFRADTDLRPALISYKTTALLPRDVALRRCVAVPEDFDARRDAMSRTYEYRLVNHEIRSPLERHYAGFAPQNLDLDLLSAAGELVEGTHDFRAFTPQKSYHIRFQRIVTRSRWIRQDDLLTYRISADSFLYGMVRALVGTMLEVAGGKRDLTEFDRLLSGGKRSEAGPAVTSRGLTLVGVGYDYPNPWRSER
ncbi:MAG: tRNA pseudouridine(38-40) synthase TruA [Rubrobacter sp.]|nr:tRNA pseudouridine(38-40) synthase TruA [Actinomycetota bacterium]MDQ3438492.1 tRNA pseudouridine(38-40) synthase TruA [Actinomycetota bacterium]